jgi:hypothetical protein
MGLLSSLVENIFDGRAIERYQATLQLRDAFLDLCRDHDYKIIRYGKTRTSREGIYTGLNHDDDIDNSWEITQEIRHGKKIIHIIYGHFDGPYHKALMANEITEQEKNKYFNFIYFSDCYGCTSTQWVRKLLEKESRMLYEQKDD